MKDVTRTEQPQQGKQPKKPKHDAFGGRYLNSYNNYHPENYGKPEGIEVSDNVDDLNTILVMGIQSLKRGVRKYPNTAEGLQQLKAEMRNYLSYIVEANNRPDIETRIYPDIEGMCVFCGISRVTLFKYAKRGEDWDEAIKFAKSIIMSAKFQLANSFKIPPLLMVFDACNNGNQYVNTSEFHIVAEQAGQAKPTETPEAISAKYGNAVLEPPKADFGSPNSSIPSKEGVE